MKIIFLLAIVLVGCLSPTASIKGRILLIPLNYSGEVFIEYGVSAAPILPLEDGWEVITIPKSGWVQTSSAMEEGWRSPDHLYFWDGKTRTPVNEIVLGYTNLGGTNGLWECPGISSPVHSQIEAFFLGTEIQWKATSYNHWGSIHCPAVSQEKSWPNKIVVPAPARGTQ